MFKKLLHVIAALACLSFCNDVALNAGDDAANEQAAVSRFFELLENNPREGLALDRVYRHHLANGTVDALLDRCKTVAAQNPVDVKMQLLAGLFCEKAGRRDEALACYQRAAELAPDDFYARRYLGRSQLEQGFAAEAAASLERAIGLASPLVTEQIDTATLLAKAYSRLGDLTKFDQLLQQVQAAFPNDDSIALSLIKTLEGEKRGGEAVTRYTRMLERLDSADAACVRWLLARADAEAKIGRRREAIADYESALNRVEAGNPVTEKVFDRVERLYHRPADAGALAEFYQKHVQANFGQADVVCRYADALLQADRTSEAEAVIANAIDKSPSDVDLHLQMIKIFAAKGDFNAADGQFELLEKIAPGRSEHVVFRGEIVLQNASIPEAERKHRAREIWRTLLDANSNAAATSALLAGLFDAAGMPEDAEAMFRLAASQREERPDLRGDFETAAYFENMIRLYDKPGNEAAAVRFFVRSLTERPDMAERPESLDLMFGAANEADQRKVAMLAGTIEGLSQFSETRSIARLLEGRLIESQRSPTYLMQTAEGFLNADDAEKSRGVLDELSHAMPQNPEMMREYAAMLARAGAPEASLEWKAAAYRLDPQPAFRDLQQLAREYEEAQALGQLYDLIRETDAAILRQHAGQLSRLIDVMTGRIRQRSDALALFDDLWNVPVTDARERLQYRSELLEGLAWNHCRELAPYYRAAVLELISPAKDGVLTDESDTLQNPHRVTAWSSEQCRPLSSALLALLSRAEAEALRDEVEQILQRHEHIDAMQRDGTRYCHAAVMKALIDLKLDRPEAAYELLKRLERHEQNVVPLVYCGATLGQEFAKLPDEKYKRYAIQCFQKYRQINRHSYGEVYIVLQLDQLEASF